MLGHWDPSTIHKITRGEIEHILKCLRFIDAAREKLEKASQPDQSIIAELRKCATGIYDIVGKLPESN